jgi:hypothetical protein
VIVRAIRVIAEREFHRADHAGRVVELRGEIDLIQVRGRGRPTLELALEGVVGLAIDGQRERTTIDRAVNPGPAAASTPDAHEKPRRSDDPSDLVHAVCMSNRPASNSSSGSVGL